MNFNLRCTTSWTLMSDRIAGLAWLINFALLYYYYYLLLFIILVIVIFVCITFDKSWMIIVGRGNSFFSSLEIFISSLSLSFFLGCFSLSRVSPFLNVFKFMALASNRRNKKREKERKKKKNNMRINSRIHHVWHNKVLDRSSFQATQLFGIQACH